MTLATRCPACGTVFRVVQDQLRVSQGWVRCGRCAEAFNALESMVDQPLPRMPPTPAAAPTPAIAENPGFLTEPSPVRAWPTSNTVLLADLPEPERGLIEEASGSFTDAGAAPLAAVSAPSPALIELPPGVSFIASDGAVSVPATTAEDEQARTEPDFDFESHARPDAGATSAETTRSIVRSEPHDAHASDGADALEPQAAVARTDPALEQTTDPVMPPSFIVQADRAERWRRPGVQRTLMLVSALTALALAAQGAYVFRDRLAVSAPWLRPTLLQACATLGCRVGDFRQIESLSVESSGLQRVEGSAVYRLAVTLRNRAAVDVAAPALDLALTDAQGRQIARRVLQMSDLNLPLRHLKAGSELPIQVPLGINERQVSGYTVEIFYP